jgi:hypothetical protein
MPTKEKIIEELGFVTGTISEQVRTIAAGALAFCLAFIVDAASRKDAALLQTEEIVGPIVFCLVAIALDFAQYFAGFALNRQMLRRMEKDSLTELKYDPASLIYRSRAWFFYAKAGSLCIGLCWLIAAIAVKLVGIIAEKIS